MICVIERGFFDTSRYARELTELEATSRTFFISSPPFYENYPGWLHIQSYVLRRRSLHMSTWVERPSTGRYSVNRVNNAGATLLISRQEYHDELCSDVKIWLSNV